MVPIVVRGEVIGTLGVGSADPGTEWCDDVGFLEVAAGQLAGAIAGELRAAEADRSVKQKDELLAVVAHEMRTPLTNIQGYAQLLERAGDDVELRDECIDAVLRGSRRLARLVDDLLDASAAEAGRLRLRPSPIDLAGIVRQAVDEFPPGPVSAAGMASLKVVADGDRLLQVVINLVGNALKYGKPPVTVEVTQDDAEMVVRVLDSGAGFPPEIQARLFTKYATLGSAKGTGIGLWLVQKIVEAHGGHVSARNRAVGGAEVEAVLPIIPDP
jgi:signal transduction histidine kinase